MSEVDQEKNIVVQENNSIRSPFVSNVLDIVETVTLCLAICLLMFTFFFRLCTVSGESMLPTLEDGQLLVISNLFYEPKTDDILVFHQTSKTESHFNEPIVKRVIATAGSEVRIDFTAATVSVDGNVLDEPYIQLTDAFGIERGEYYVFSSHDVSHEMIDGSQHTIMQFTVPDGKIFVMGDNRNHSSDSRTDIIGFVDERRVLGRVLFRITPLSRFGKVD